MHAIWLTLALFLLGLTPLRVSAATDPTALAADYYFTHSDYPQALQLWKQELEQEPDSLIANSRVADLKLMLEGREPARDVLLAYLNRKTETITEADRNTAKARLLAVASTFLTDEGQSDYLQALPRLNHHDWPQALALLNQANTLEKGNLKILREKARCEFSLAAYDRYYASLKQAYEMDPFESGIREDLSEAELYFKDFSEAIALLKKKDDSNLSDKARLELGFALAETDNPLALTYLKPLADSGTHNLPAVFYFEEGKLLAARAETAQLSIRYLQNFLSQTQTKTSQPTSTVSSTPIEPVVWDPYHTVDKIPEARRLLLSLQTPSEH